MSEKENTKNEPEEEKSFRKELKRIRLSKHVTQNDFAKLMNEQGWGDFTQAVVSRLENGARPLTLAESRAVAKALGTTVEKMVNPIQANDRFLIAGERHRELELSYNSLVAEIKQFYKTRNKFFKEDPALSEAENFDLMKTLFLGFIFSYDCMTLWEACKEALMHEWDFFDNKEKSFFRWVTLQLGVEPTPTLQDENRDRVEQLISDTKKANDTEIP